MGMFRLNMFFSFTNGDDPQGLQITVTFPFIDEHLA